MSITHIQQHFDLDKHEAEAPFHVTTVRLEPTANQCEWGKLYEAKGQRFMPIRLLGFGKYRYEFWIDGNIIAVCDETLMNYGYDMPNGCPTEEELMNLLISGVDVGQWILDNADRCGSIFLRDQIRYIPKQDIIPFDYEPPKNTLVLPPKVLSSLPHEKKKINVNRKCVKCSNGSCRT